MGCQCWQIHRSRHNYTRYKSIIYSCRFNQHTIHVPFISNIFCRSLIFQLLTRVHQVIVRCIRSERDLVSIISPFGFNLLFSFDTCRSVCAHCGPGLGVQRRCEGSQLWWQRRRWYRWAIGAWRCWKALESNIRRWSVQFHRCEHTRWTRKSRQTYWWQKFNQRMDQQSQTRRKAIVCVE